MPFHSPFNLPYFFRPNYKYNYYKTPYTPNYINDNHTQNSNIEESYKETKTEDSNRKQKACLEESSECLFEIFGLKLYLDDVLIMCLLYFLYTEGVQDQELFLCLILLLLS